MNCRQAQHQIFAERDGALDEHQRAALVSHVSECGGCRQIRENLAVTMETWRSESAAVRVPDPDIEWQKVRREIRNSAQPERRSIFNWATIPLMAAAALAVGLYVVPFGHQTGTAPETGPSIARETTSTPAAQVASTVVFVDDQSGWTFVVGSGSDTTG